MAAALRESGQLQVVTYAPENFDTFLKPQLIPESAQDYIGKRDHFLPAQASEPGKLGAPIALSREHRSLQPDHTGVRWIVNPIQEVRTAGHTDVRREGRLGPQRCMTYPLPALGTSRNQNRLMVRADCKPAEHPRQAQIRLRSGLQAFAAKNQAQQVTLHGIPFEAVPAEANIGFIVSVN